MDKTVIESIKEMASRSGCRYQGKGRRARRCKINRTKNSQAMLKVPGLVVHERMSQGDKVRGTKERKKV